MRHMLRTCTVRHAARLSTAVWSLETLLCWVLSSWVWSSGSRTYVQLHTRLAGAGGRGGEWATARIAAAQQLADTDRHGVNARSLWPQCARTPAPPPERAHASGNTACGAEPQCAL